MSKLNYIGRPWVIFDPYNKQHRSWFHEFQRFNTWGRCPVRFVVADDGGDLVGMMQRQLVQYYVDKEFSKNIKPVKRTNDLKSRAQQLTSKFVIK